MYGAYGVLAALLERERTGRGQVVRTSLLAAIVGVHAFQGTAWTVAGKVGRAQGNHHPSIAPYGLFHCADGSVQVACASESLWRKLCAEFGFDPEAPGHGDQRRAGGEPRRGDRGCSRAPSPHIDAEDLLARLNTVGHPGGQGPHDRRGLRLGPGALPGPAGRRRARHARAGCQLPGPPLRFFAPGPDGETETTRRDHAAPPLLGADGDAIRAVAVRRRTRHVSAHVEGPTGSPRRPDAARPGPRPGVVAVLGLARSAAARSPRSTRAELAAAAEKTPPGRVDHHRRGHAARTARGRRRRRVRLPRRIDRRRRRRAADRRGRAGHRGGPAAAGRAGLRRHPDAGGHGRLPADDRDHRGRSPGTRRPGCRTWSTCATPPSAACSPRGDRSGT